jgi:uncharacterized protein with GYD domain
VPKVLWKVKYSAEGAKGLMKDGGSKRRAVVEEILKTRGGRLESFYYAFGDHDAYVIVDVPSNADATAIALSVGASGAVQISTVMLITPEEVDEAAKASIDYKAPGK